MQATDLAIPPQPNPQNRGHKRSTDHVGPLGDGRDGATLLVLANEADSRFANPLRPLMDMTADSKYTLENVNPNLCNTWHMSGAKLMVD